MCEGQDRDDIAFENLGRALTAVNDLLKLHPQAQKPDWLSHILFKPWALQIKMIEELVENKEFWRQLEKPCRIRRGLRSKLVIAKQYI
ncbi:MAG: hypothetical protein MUD10_00440 [Candidatus Pacebacteria bacterium]|jgi:hypothetical protein|nr:hypothetical protein [Candidatus Paceibacterota bacterium]